MIWLSCFVHSNKMFKYKNKISSPCLSVTDDQFSLASANGYQAVHGFDSRLHGLTYRDTGDDTWGFCSYTGTVFCVEWALKNAYINAILALFWRVCFNQYMTSKLSHLSLLPLCFTVLLWSPFVSFLQLFIYQFINTYFAVDGSSQSIDYPA